MKKYINLEDMTNTNCANVLAVIRENGVISRKEITDKTGLSWGGMTKIVNKLLENGYIIEEKQKQSSGSGRTPGFISVNTDRNFVVGLDVNKTGLKAIVMNLAGQGLREYESPVHSDCKDGLLTEITEFVAGIFADYESGVIIAMGVAMQGMVDSVNGISVMFPHIPDWKDVPLQNILSRMFGVNVFIEHDPDCLLYPFLGEKKENCLLLRIDKSIGMAVSVRNRILKDKGILEIAHTVAVPDGKECTCGLKGCVEAYVSPCLENGEPCLSAIDELVPALAVIIKNMSVIFNTRTVILTGELVKHKEIFELYLLKELDDYNCSADVVFSYDENYAVQGAALIAISKSINSLVI